MANPTTNFGWVMPTSSSLVTNLPADFNTFGQAVDTSMSELLGGTTGQVLSKTSNTNMDFTWVTPTDQTPLTTKGDLFTFTTVDARLGVGANDTVLTADSTAATGLKWATPAGGGGMTLLSTTSLSGTTTTISSISQSYNTLYILIKGSDKAGAIRLNGSSTLFAGVQTWVLNTTITDTGISAGELRINAGDGVSTGYTGTQAVTVYNYTDTTYWKPVTQFGGFTGASYNVPLSFIGVQKTASAITSVSIVSDSGSFGAGSVLVYGVK